MTVSSVPLIVEFQEPDAGLGSSLPSVRCPCFQTSLATPYIRVSMPSKISHSLDGLLLHPLRATPPSAKAIQYPVVSSRSVQ
jgi:hypothetical protein